MLRLGLALERNLNRTERAATTDFDRRERKDRREHSRN